MEISNHVKVKWVIRGGNNRSISHAWDEGIAVKLPNYTYGEARYDRKASIALLKNGSEITTAINVYEHTEMIPLRQVGCNDCGSDFQDMEECPTCGSLSWRKR